MSTRAAVTTVRPKGLFYKVLVASILMVGPLASVWWLSSQAGGSWLPLSALGPVLWAVLIAWSPLPISIPALILQDARDNALADMVGIKGTMVRSVKLLGHLAWSPESPVRAEMIGSLLGFAAAAIVVVGAH